MNTAVRAGERAMFMDPGSRVRDDGRKPGLELVQMSWKRHPGLDPGSTFFTSPPEE
jgi:hypothetical protein